MPRTREGDEKAVVPVDQVYDVLVADLRQIIGEGRGRVAAVNTEIIATYGKIGARLVAEEQRGKEGDYSAYGDQLLRQIGNTVLSR